MTQDASHCLRKLCCAVSAFPSCSLRPSESRVQGHFFEIPVVEVGSCTDQGYLGCDSGLAAVIRAVIDGSLAPFGYTNR